MSTDDLPPFFPDEVPPPRQQWKRPDLRVVEPPPISDGDLRRVNRDRVPPKAAQVADAALIASGEMAHRENTVIRSRCYASAVAVVQADRFGILEGRKLAWNEMTGQVTFDGQAQQDTDVLRLRYMIERRCSGGEDKHGNQKPLQFSKQDLEDAVLHVAKSRAYHPVRDYLTGLTWDGHSRMRDLLTWINVEPTALAQTLLRKWLISAVARAMEPGCKADTMLVLVGNQGYYKSAFFEAMASRAFFCDTELDIRNKDSFMLIRRTWIYEWPELTSLFRPRDIDAVKSFLTSRLDVYRPSYGRHVVESPRNCVVAGTTNRPEFLTDETGNRRFWPLTVNARVDKARIVAERDQLWAEAVAGFRAGGDYAWWLSPDEEMALAEAQKEFVVDDAWDNLVAEYARRPDVPRPFQTADVLRAIKKEHDKWTSGDEARVGRILARMGFVKRRDDGKRVWMPQGSVREPGQEG